MLSIPVYLQHWGFLSVRCLFSTIWQNRNKFHAYWMISTTENDKILPSFCWGSLSMHLFSLQTFCSGQPGMLPRALSASLSLHSLSYRATIFHCLIFPGGSSVFFVRSLFCHFIDPHSSKFPHRETFPPTPIIPIPENALKWYDSFPCHLYHFIVLFVMCQLLNICLFCFVKWPAE